MTPPAAGAWSGARMRLLGLGAAALLALLWLVDTGWHRRVRLAWFDSYQMVLPRKVQAMPAVVVAIDEKSLAAFGQWPWPRSVMARLVEAIAAHRPAAIAIDLLWVEPDRYSPAEIARSLPESEALARERLKALPSSDALLAQAIARAPVVLGVAGLPGATPATLRAPPLLLSGGEAPHGLRRFEGVLTSLAGVDDAATGRGLLSTDLEGGVVRRMLLLGDVAGTPVPGLAIEALRVATRSPALSLELADGRPRRIGVKGFGQALDGDGATWIHFSPRLPERLVSAADVLSGDGVADRLAGRIVLIGVTGLGLLDYQTAATGERMPGVEVHAQLLEMIADGVSLTRPPAMRAFEWVAYALGAVLLVWLVPVVAPRRAVALGVGVVLLVAACGWLLFARAGLLFDAANPGLNLILVFGALLAISLAAATRRERALALEVQRAREEAARVAGELDAARRIQTGILPRAEALSGERRVDVAAAMTPAREVGGDLYDFFLLPGGRLFFLVGDVSGKGLPASIFMAVSKALYKSNALREGTPGDDVALVGRLMTLANAEVSRENGEAMFVTLFAGILDLESGALAYCNAGHDDPWQLAAGGAMARLRGGDGPPLCVVDDFEYAGAGVSLAPGAVLCLVTDGVTEAQDPSGALYGGARLEQLLSRSLHTTSGAAQWLETIRADVAAYAAGAEPADDLTILILRWLGPSPG